jgi:hypothetical protein
MLPATTHRPFSFSLKPDAISRHELPPTFRTYSWIDHVPHVEKTTSDAKPKGDAKIAYRQEIIL